MKQRKGETIGGGFFVFRRGKKTGRVGCKTPWMPFEHPAKSAAIAEADRLGRRYPGETFEVFATTGATICHDVQGTIRQRPEDAA